LAVKKRFNKNKGGFFCGWAKYRAEWGILTDEPGFWGIQGETIFIFY
jgi:hypothetical protein